MAVTAYERGAPSPCPFGTFEAKRPVRFHNSQVHGCVSSHTSLMVEESYRDNVRGAAGASAMISITVGMQISDIGFRSGSGRDVWWVNVLTREGWAG